MSSFVFILYIFRCFSTTRTSSAEIEGTDRRGGKASGNICTCSSNGHDGLLQVGSAGKCSPSCDPHHHQGRFWQALGTPCSHHEEACLGSPHPAAC